MVMQIHPGCWRNHNPSDLFRRFGRNIGGDMPMRAASWAGSSRCWTGSATTPDFTLILFTLDETTYSRELAPLAGHYPCLKLGPAWWFHDSPEGMMRYPPPDDGKRRLLQHRRLQRRHPRLLFHSRAPRPGAADRLRLSVRAGRQATVCPWTKPPSWPPISPIACRKWRTSFEIFPPPRSGGGVAQAKRSATEGGSPPREVPLRLASLALARHLAC